MTHVVVIGAGPAGLAAAGHALDAGAEVTVLDQADTPGGQYHRGAAHRFGPLLDRCTWWPESTVWALEGKRVHVLRGPADGTDRARHTLEPDALVLATGAHDRVLPFPGWQLPGVFTAGAAQALAKGEGVAVGRRVLVAGAGPFLLPVAGSLLHAGAGVLAVLEANPLPAVLDGWSWRAAAHVGKLGELGRYAGTLARHRVPYHLGRTVIEARGDDRVREAVTARVRADWSVVPGTERTHEVDALCVSHGFVPQPELAVAAGCALDGGFVRVGPDQRTSVSGVFAAGELTGIGGAAAAAAEGAIAGRAAAGGTPSRALLRKRAHARAFARRLAAAHPIGPAWRGWLRTDTIVCRCEETTYDDLERAVADPAAPGPHALKLGTRAGLGPCQGRMCGAAVADLCGTPERHHRPIAQPIRLGELADPKETPA
ncbi:NAD(P)/FAD-dependent oxidoreductase [Amycolatopsis sp. CA-128772]|uniref:FAD/NAD(P)-dependent oxidoreductase n=1 Tax=Amycolatopsis sp. CA-128772 TaxID=2073159 RepID=UPI000CD29918|nr:NAD(P)/FAD-dependent oxidoreductase [Amycolatopsis sp. CA-128772]